MKRFMNSGTAILLLILLISNFVNGGLRDPRTYFFNMLLSLPGIVIGLSFHEFAHAWTSWKLGDPTPKNQGRVTLNPAAHFDPFGFLALMFCGFGWGIPVEIDNRYYQHPRRDELLVSVAGVAMNLLIAVVLSFVTHFYMGSTGYYQMDLNTVPGLIMTILIQAIIINITLLVFNIIPLPPLDGFGIITEIFNLRKKSWYYDFYSKGNIILILLLIVGAVNGIISPLISIIYKALLYGVIL